MLYTGDGVIRKGGEDTQAQGVYEEAVLREDNANSTDTVNTDEIKPKKRGRKKKSEVSTLSDKDTKNTTQSKKTATEKKTEKSTSEKKSTPSPRKLKKRNIPDPDTQLETYYDNLNKAVLNASLSPDSTINDIDTPITDRNNPDNISNAVYSDNTDMSDTLLDTSINPNLKDTDISKVINEPVLPKKKTMNNRNANKVNRVSFATHDGHALTPQESMFIDRYIETGNGRQSVIDAGYQCKAPAQYAQTLLNKSYITSEINYRLEVSKNEAIASASEIMQYFTDVMRGKIKDQFDMEASLSERTKAAQELAKRQIDIPNRLAGNEEPTLRIKLDFGQGEDGAPMKTVEPVKPDIKIEGLTD